MFTLMLVSKRMKVFAEQILYRNIFFTLDDISNAKRMLLTLGKRPDFAKYVRTFTVGSIDNYQPVGNTTGCTHPDIHFVIESPSTVIVKAVRESCYLYADVYCDVLLS
jgi:hypothetical protein